MSNIDEIIGHVLEVEGGYTHDELDSGGETNYGVTISTAKAYGYFGNMKDLPVSLAKNIYLNKYWIEPKFDQVNTLSKSIAEELCDTGVNCGISFAKKSLQSSLNLLNRQGNDYPDIVEDGDIGSATLSALATFLIKRGKEGEKVLVKVLNIMQGSRYIEITKSNPSQEKFFYGWVSNRVNI